MGLSPNDRKQGGHAVAKKYGSEYMRKIGKKGRAKQLAEKQLSSNRAI